MMTSAKDKNGDRILGSPAGETIQKEVLEKGKEYFSDSVSIDGTLHYGYYVPVYQGDSKKPVGMIFVGANKAQKDSAINTDHQYRDLSGIGCDDALYRSGSSVCF